MQRTLLSIGAAAVMLAAALPIAAQAQRGAALAAPGGGGAAVAPGGGAPHAMAPSGGAPRAAAPGGAAIAVAPGGAPRAVAPGGAAIAPGAAIPAPRGGQRFAQPGGGWQGGTWHGRRHFRGGFAFAVPYPYYDDYATPYAYDDSCYELRFIRGAYRRVWVCD